MYLRKSAIPLNLTHVYNIPRVNAMSTLYTYTDIQN